ncbi:MAG TPA: hypothetical protein VFS58_02625 [Steroidobacteraceae bacterium]|nr:hypothetical protein [Steroidobacteraceae bacterium]
MMLDVTDQRRLETELAQAQKLDSVGRLAAGVANEINTPVKFVSDSVHFWIYGAFGLLAAFVVLRFVPETKGVDGDQVAALWRRESYFSFSSR